jgi:hypothetical protein
VQETDYSGIAERAVLVGLLTDDTVATRIASQWTASGLFASAYANTLAGWAVAYAQRYGQAPRDRIMLQFASWSRKVKDSSTVQMVRELLESLDGEWSGANSNSQYILDQAQNLFESVALRSVAEQMEAALDVGDVAAARRISTSTVIPQLSGSTWFNPLTDELGMKGAFAAKSAPLIQMPGDMGTFLGTTLERDAFVAFRGIAKVGKSFTLMSLAYEAVRQKNKTLFIAIGDMSADQVRLRWASRVSRRPRVASTVLVPISWDDDADPASPRPVFNEVVHTESLSPEIVMAKSQRFMHRYQIPEDTFRVSIHPSRSLSVLGLHDMLQRGAAEGWAPDVIIIDYVDLMGPVPGIQEKRDQIDETWARLRGLSQEYHNLIITASQSDTQGYTKEVLGMENFNGSRTQNDHPTAIISLNQNQEEATFGLVRWHMTANRDNNERRQLMVAGCRGIGNPMILSKFCE